METYIKISNFQIPEDLLPLYKEVSKEFEIKVCDAVKTGGKNELAKKDY